MGSSRWCPWCAAELAAAAPVAEDHCGKCGARIPAGTALTAPPERPLHVEDPESRIPPRGPDGSAPLPQGSAVMSTEAMVRWAILFGAGLIAIAATAFLIGRPLYTRIPDPTPFPIPAPLLEPSPPPPPPPPSSAAPTR